MLKILNDLTSFVFALIEILLVFRFLLKLLAANGGSKFVAWVYQTTQPLLNPFLFAFPTPQVKGGFVLEFTTLFAIFAYAFIGYLISEFLKALSRRK